MQLGGELTVTTSTLLPGQLSPMLARYQTDPPGRTTLVRAAS